MYPHSIIGEIITELTPLYNKYKIEKNILSGAEAIEIKRDMGDILKKYIDKYEIKNPHTLYRDIYGKGNSSHNAVQNSYITREDQGRCYRIRNMFPDKSEIKKLFPNLVSFTAFREAMPFFDNPKYKLEGKERENLLELLNSKAGKTQVITKIRKLQDEKIGISNTRTQKIGAMKEGLKQNFVDVFNDMKELLQLDYSEVEKRLSDYNITNEDLTTLSNNIKGFTNDSYLMKAIDSSKINSENWKALIDGINGIVIKNKMEDRRRVQRVIAPTVLALISDMVMSLTNEDYFDNYKKNHK